MFERLLQNTSQIYLDIPDMSSATVFMQMNSKFALYSSNSDVLLIDVNNKCMMCTQGSRDTSLYVCFKTRQIYEQADITKENDHIFSIVFRQIQKWKQYQRSWKHYRVNTEIN